MQDIECRKSLRNFFKSIHEALYDIERSKEQDLNLILGNLLGQFQNEGGQLEAQRVSLLCKSKADVISSRLEHDQISTTALKEEKYQSIIKRARVVKSNLETFQAKSKLVNLERMQQLSVFNLEETIEKLHLIMNTAVNFNKVMQTA